MSSEIATRTPMQEVLEHVASDNFVAKLANALPEKVSPQKFVSVTVTAIRQNPELITADRDSLYNSVVRCAQDGLMPDGREAALVIYKVKGRDVCQYMPMVGGYRKIAAKHGISLVADVVRDGDEFRYSKVPPSLTHVPAPLGRDRGEIVGAYAVALYPSGQLVTAPEVMTPDEIEKVRAVSRAKDSQYGPWVNWWERMAAKTVARRLFSQLPLAEQDEETQRIIAANDAEYDLPSPEPSMSEAEANIVAMSKSLPQPEEEDTHVRDEPEAERLDEALLNRLAMLADSYEGDVTTYLVGAFNVDRFDRLTPAQAVQAEAALRRLIEAQAEHVEEGVYEEPDPFADIESQSEREARIAAENAAAGEQTSFADRIPESAKPRRRRSS